MILYFLCLLALIIHELGLENKGIESQPGLITFNLNLILTCNIMHTVTCNTETAIRKKNSTNNRYSVFLSRFYNACMSAYQVQLHLWHQWPALCEILVALEAVPIIWHNEKEVQLYSKGWLFMYIKGTLYLLI